MKFFEKAIENEVKSYLPFIVSTRLLMESVNKGSNREEVYIAIKEHSNKALDEFSKNKLDKEKFALKIANDPRIPLDIKNVGKILEDHKYFSASAPKQSEKFASEVDKWTERFPESKKIKQEGIL